MKREGKEERKRVGDSKMIVMAGRNTKWRERTPSERGEMSNT